MLTLYGRPNSSNVQKVRWALAEEHIPYAFELRGGEHGGLDAEPFDAMPTPGVPMLVDDGAVLWESNAIVRHLATAHGRGVLGPAESRSRALADAWMDWCASHLGPDMRTLFQGLAHTPPEQRDGPAIDAARTRLTLSWAKVDRVLGAAPFIAGSAFSFGDLPLGVLAPRWFALCEEPPSSALADWLARLHERPAFQATVAGR